MKKKAPTRLVFQMRVTEEFLAEVDDWRRGQKKIPTMSDAVKMLVAKGIGRRRIDHENVIKK